MYTRALYSAFVSHRVQLFQQIYTCTKAILVTVSYAAPTAGPSLVIATVMDSTTISLQWDEVSCLQQNSEITNYTVQYFPVGQTGFMTVSSGDRMADLTGLDPFTNYSFAVAAVNSDSEIGQFSTPIAVHTPAASKFIYKYKQQALLSCRLGMGNLRRALHLS